MRKFLSTIALLIGLPISIVLIWIGYSEITLTLVWSHRFDTTNIFYLLLGLIGILLFITLITWGLSEYAKLTGGILFVSGILVILFVGYFQTLPFIRSLAEKEFSTEFMSTVALWHGNITHEPPRVYPTLVQEWQTIELVDTIFGTALSVILLLLAFQGLFWAKKPEIEQYAFSE